MNLREKKGYHVYLAIDAMKAFRKICIEEAVPVGHAIETLILREIEYRRGINWDVVPDITTDSVVTSSVSSPEESSQIVV